MFETLTDDQLAEKRDAEIAKMRATQREICAFDADGTWIRIGQLVQYTRTRNDNYGNTVWNVSRWGVVTGIARTPGHLASLTTDVSIRVSRVDVSDDDEGRWHNEEWFCSPEMLRVIP